MAEEQEAPKKRSAVKIMVGVALLLVIAGTGVWYFTARKAGAQEKGSKPERPQIKAVMHLEGFVVNLADPEERAFLRAGIDIGLDKEPGEAEVTERSQRCRPRKFVTPF